MNTFCFNELIIGDHNGDKHQESGRGHAKGLVPRDYGTYPVGFSALGPPMEGVDIPLIPTSEYVNRIADQLAAKARLSDIRMIGGPNGGMIPSRDQGQKGYCWAHSTVAGVIYQRAVQGLPYVSLSAYAVACIIKSFQDEGGWGALSMEFLTTRGCPGDKFWPQQSMSRSNDNAETWANAALHKVVEGWVDLQAAVYDRNLSDQQVSTLLLSGTPVVIDLNWWSHSVLAIDLVDGSTQRGATRDESGKLLDLAAFDAAWGMDHEVTGGIGKRIQNSWGDSWSDRGMGILTGSKAIADGAVGIRSVLASVV